MSQPKGQFHRLTFLGLGLAATSILSAAPVEYEQREIRMKMRDGTALHTILEIPAGTTGRHPILLERTPYQAGRYGRTKLTKNDTDPLVKAGFIFAYQDVRGRYMSEGTFSELRPVNQHPTGKDADETTDAWDTIDQLSKLKESNGKVGITGVSYPGGYAALGSIRNHPALAASSPQAPTANWWIGDDDHHFGALFLQSAFEFITWFGSKNVGPPDFYTDTINVNYQGDAYKFFLELGPLKNANLKYFKGTSSYWNDLMRHPDYDEYWQSRSVPHQMKEVKTPVMTVGGWFDAEDLWGALNVHAYTEKFNPKTPTYLVMGPWSHGQWGGRANRLGPADWGSDTGAWYREKIETPFWLHHLNGGPAPKISKATVFETGGNRWHGFSAWPPKNAKPWVVSLEAGGRLKIGSPSEESPSVTKYDADPASPVPYQKQPQTFRTSTYMVDDQRFLEGRNDVASWTSEPLADNLTLAGPLLAHLRTSTTGTDADYVVKLIDVLPDGTQRLIRAEIMRGRYRHSFTTPSPFISNLPDWVKLPLNDTFHTWKKGHKLMVQIQSSWFPLFDRNANQFVNLAEADEKDFIKAQISILCGKGGSKIEGFSLALPEKPASVLP